MAKTEKIAFILEQVRLCLDRGDYVRSGCRSMRHPASASLLHIQPGYGSSSNMPSDKLHVLTLRVGGS